ncbi:MULTISPECIES: AbrB/MazE/SpoVT family DNA-binding domain-containing protein [Bacillus]|uniref:AbrB/MazE/SpoVT family DNA-binding domain-containing protein n=1 Tax=Bacillus TaxID=1386 RepID=UPI00069CEDB3|nr:MULTISPECIES: AbrB/MazE/SpoVT family DNA-binding domain-containing protein [Bacillus]MDH6595629.1 transcriptional pleiotropic regulator of transition state genes [Bacillus aerius]MED1422482.1 AbrB/MazE/SpoVT family DNA-binding domain-containing protein [Bacillus altitudinis]MED1480583.1 AbrB/MazE/SpoVT family DNA-binding domain-containing protein [Bacillus altitudinis]QCU17795.1 transcriptional regulator [Bacillus altitudinis]QEO60944.1 transcriptional regulator [Bacillus altitudinis]
MLNEDYVRFIDKFGRVVLPTDVRKRLKIRSQDFVEIYQEESHIVIKPYWRDKPCIVTGQVTCSNKALSGGVVVSPEGARLLLQDLLALRLQKEI